MVASHFLRWVSTSSVLSATKDFWKRCGNRIMNALWCYILQNKSLDTNKKAEIKKFKKKEQKTCSNCSSNNSSWINIICWFPHLDFIQFFSVCLGQLFYLFIHSLYQHVYVLCLLFQILGKIKAKNYIHVVKISKSKHQICKKKKKKFSLD